jgi:hypothetical protein
MNNSERRADMLRFARVWLSLTEPIGNLPIPRSPDNAGDHARVLAGEITAHAGNAVIAALKNRGGTLTNTPGR